MSKTKVPGQGAIVCLAWVNSVDWQKGSTGEVAERFKAAVLKTVEG